MTAGNFPNSKGQGALEYLLLIGGAVLIAAVAITLLASSGASGTKTTKTSKSTFLTEMDKLDALAGVYNCYSQNAAPFNVYLINATDSPNAGTGPPELITLIGTDPNSGLIKGIKDAKGVSINVTQITSAWDLNSRLNDAPENSIFINIHGAVIPIPDDPQWIGSTADRIPDYNAWFNFIAGRVDKGKYVWVSAGGYPFELVGNNTINAGSWTWIPQVGYHSLGQDHNGAKAFLDQFSDAYSVDEANIIFATVALVPTEDRSVPTKITDAGKALETCWGIDLPDSIDRNWAVPAGANPNSNRVFYVDVDGGEQSVEYVKIGGGYFVHIGTDFNSDFQAKASLAVALHAASIANQK